MPFAAAAEPIQLTLSFFASEHTETYEHGVKPFVDAVNAEGKGILAIKVYPDGALGRALAEQPGMVLEGVADIAWVVPGQTPYRFPDNQLLELPGLFRDVREGTLAYTQLIAAKALRGYQDFYVIGAFTSDPSIIHSRKPIGSLSALKGQKIRANNAIEAEALQRLGAIPTVMPASRLADALAKGAVDGAVMSPTGLVPIRCIAGGDESLPCGYRCCAAGGGHESQEIRLLARSGEGDHPQVQRRAGGRDLDRTRSGSSRSRCSTSSNQTLEHKTS